MKRGAGPLALVLVVGLLCAPLAVAAQPKKVPRIGFLSSTAPADGIAPFRQALQEFGYVDGQNIAVEWRFTEGRDERASDMAAELVRLGVDVIVAVTAASVVAAKRATATIPIVFVRIFDPVGRGFVASIAHPGGNLTGVAQGFAGPEVNAKRLEVLLEAVPGAERVAILRYKSPVLAELPRSSVDVLQDAGRALGVRLQLVHVQVPEDLDGLLGTISRQRAQALLVVGSPFFLAHRARLLEVVAKSRLPAIYPQRVFVEQGGLMTYADKAQEHFRRAASQVDRVLKGAKPGDLPVEQVTKFELLINLAAAKKLGLAIPRSLLLRADQVIE
jgi:putative ABC transport system substrate-binding protein